MLSCCPNAFSEGGPVVAAVRAACLPALVGARCLAALYYAELDSPLFVCCIWLDKCAPPSRRRSNLSVWRSKLNLRCENAAESRTTR